MAPEMLIGGRKRCLTSRDDIADAAWLPKRGSALSFASDCSTMRAADILEAVCGGKVPTATIGEPGISIGLIV